MRRLTLLAAICVSLVTPKVGEAAIELITNGDFSSGLSGWTVSEQAGSNGSWYASTVGAKTPISMHSTSSANATTSAGTAAAAGGYAVTDQAGNTAAALIQSFTVPGVASSVILTFDMFVNDQSGMGPLVSALGLDYTAPKNQHARVDVLSGSSSPLDTGSAVLLAVYSGNDPFAFNPNAFTRYVVDITSLVGNGGTFDLRFAEVNNQLWMHQGIDNVSVKFTGIADNPEPMTLAMWSALAGLGGVVAYRKRRAGK